MEKKVMWFQMHLDSIRPVQHLPAQANGTQTNIVGWCFSKREAGVLDCGIVDHYIDKRKTPWLKHRIFIGNLAECTYFKWDKIDLILHTVLQFSMSFTRSCIAVTTCGGSWASMSVTSLWILIWMQKKTSRCWRKTIIAGNAFWLKPILGTLQPMT